MLVWFVSGFLLAIIFFFLTPVWWLCSGVFCSWMFLSSSWPLFEVWWCFPLVGCWVLWLFFGSNRRVGVAWCAFLLALLLISFLFRFPCFSWGLGVLSQSQIETLNLVDFRHVVLFLALLTDFLLWPCTFRLNVFGSSLLRMVLFLVPPWWLMLGFLVFLG